MWVLVGCVNEDLPYNRAPIGTDCWPTVELVLILLTMVELAPRLALIDLVQGVTLIGGVADVSALITPPVFRFGPCAFMELTGFGCIYLYITLPIYNMIISSLNAPLIDNPFNVGITQIVVFGA